MVLGWKREGSVLEKGWREGRGGSESIEEETGPDMLEREGKRFSKGDLFRRESWEMLS